MIHLLNYAIDFNFYLSLFHLYLFYPNLFNFKFLQKLNSIDFQDVFLFYPLLFDLTIDDLISILNFFRLNLNLKYHLD